MIVIDMISNFGGFCVLICNNDCTFKLINGTLINIEIVNKFSLNS